MVSRDEIIFTRNWFVDKYIEFKHPIGSAIITPDKRELTEEDMLRIKFHIETYINVIFGNNTNFRDDQINMCIEKFGMEPQDIMENFNIEFKKKFKYGGTKGNALMRIAPFFGLDEDSLDIYFELTDNDCIRDHLVDESESEIRKGCNIIIFQYDNKNVLDTLPYENKNDRYIIVDGNKMADILNMNPEFMKKLISTSFIPNNSKLLIKIRQNPGVVISMSDLFRKWLFRTVSPTKLLRTKK